MKTIIVADDSNIIINIVKKAFEGEYDVLSAKNGAETIELLQSNELDEIVGLLLDLNMPEVNGFAVLDYLHSNGLLTKIPVSIITGDDDMAVIKKAFEYNIIDVLKKPFNIDNIKKIVEKTISIRSVEYM